jgi:hypothetical protein
MSVQYVGSTANSPRPFGSNGQAGRETGVLTEIRATDADGRLIACAGVRTGSHDLSAPKGQSPAGR